jgi:predicted Zn-ribbon and HTH transcriptional regulator
LKDNKGRKMIANKADIKNCGFGSEEEIIGKTDSKCFQKKLQKNSGQMILEYLNMGSNY